MMKTQTPLRLWCFCYKYMSNLLSLLAIGKCNVHGHTPYKVVMNYTRDILEYVSFTWLQCCWYFEEDTWSKHLCCWLGPAHHAGQSFCSHIVLPNGIFTAQLTNVPIPLDELKSDDLIKRSKIFMDCLCERVGNEKKTIYNVQDSQQIYHQTFGDNVEDDLNDLPYGTELIDLETTKINDSYIEGLDEYI